MRAADVDTDQSRCFFSDANRLGNLKFLLKLYYGNLVHSAVISLIINTYSPTEYAEYTSALFLVLNVFCYRYKLKKYHAVFCVVLFVFAS